MEKETKTIRKITLTFNNDLEYLVFIKALAKGTETNLAIKNLAEEMFTSEYEEIVNDDKLHELYKGLYPIIE